MNMMTSRIEPSEGRLAPPLALLRSLPPGPLATKYQRLKQMADLFAAFDRDDMEAGVDLLLAELDARDGDPDIEPDGDELDGNASEDDCMVHDPKMAGFPMPGCPISDSGIGDRDALEENEEPDGRAIRQPHINYIRQTRCRAVRHWGVTNYYLQP